MLILVLLMPRSFICSIKEFWRKVMNSLKRAEEITADDKNRARDGVEEQIHTQLEYFRELRACDVMIPRHAVISVSDQILLEDLYNKFITSALTRIPVCKELSDEMIGFVHVKDFLPYVPLMKSSGSDKKFDIYMILRKLMYSSRSTNCIDLLTKMRQDAMQISVIVDEHGEVDGIVMMELLIERIIGDIRDEHDVNKPMPVLVSRIAANEYSVQARATIEKLNEEFGDDLLEISPEYETLGGMIMAYLNRVPKEGEIILLNPEIEIEVISADARKVSTVLLRLTNR